MENELLVLPKSSWTLHKYILFYLCLKLCDPELHNVIQMLMLVLQLIWINSSMPSILSQLFKLAVPFRKLVLYLLRTWMV